MGYLIEYSKKSGWMTDEGYHSERINALVTSDQLAEILKKKPLWTVWSARLLNMDEYRMNHDPSEYEDLAKGESK